MRTFLAPNGEYITVPDGRVITLGLTEEENDIVSVCFPVKGFELLTTTDFADFMANSCTALIINASVLNEDERAMIFEFYMESDGCTDEDVIWIGEPKPPVQLDRRFKCFQDFDDLIAELKYLLLQAHRRIKKSIAFSRKMADCIKILSMIRSRPGIKTSDIVEKTELSARTVQRHIATLQAAGEWIAYDYSKKGWYLQDGISVLFGDI